MVLDEEVMRPDTADDVHYISTLEMVTTLLNHYPHFSKRINVITIGKLLNDRGFKSIRRGRNKTTCYAISNKSGILKLNDGEFNDRVYLG